MILQTIPLWTVNGLAKTGEMWALGDSFYYALEHPQLRRWPMHVVASMFGTNLFRWMTWVVHVFEVFFPLVIVGLAIREIREHDERPGHPRIVTRIGWIVIAGCALGLAWTAWPVDVRSRLPFVAVTLTAFAIAQAAILRPRIPDAVLRWVLGRRVWVTFAVLFSVHLSVLMTWGCSRSW